MLALALVASLVLITGTRKAGRRTSEDPNSGALSRS